MIARRHWSSMIQLEKCLAIEGQSKFDALAIGLGLLGKKLPGL